MGSIVNVQSGPFYFGSYEVEDTTLTIPGPIGATEMYRMDPEGVMDQEQEYLSLLQQSEAYSITGDILSITCGNQILIFRYTTGLKPAS
ncbi:META domain-containing protein [Chloroflexota bacterium]